MGNEQQSEGASVEEFDGAGLAEESQSEKPGVEQPDIEPDTANVSFEALQQELKEAREQALRAAAELQNVRRRAQQDVEKAHKFALESFVKDMLPVADNLERTIDAAAAEGAGIEALVEGVELTLKNLIDGLKRSNVEAVDPEGEPFNPELHQAMSLVASGDVEPNTVLNVFQKGYTLNGRLVRPAMVVVSKAED